MKIYLCKIFIILLMILSTNVALANQKFLWKCNSKQSCNLFAQTIQGKDVQIFKNWNKSDIGNAAFKYYANNLGKVSYSCGSPCDYSTFVNFKDGKISSSYFLVEAIDPHHLLIALPDIDDKNDDTLEIRPIFDNSKQSIKIMRPFSRGASISLTKSEFLKDKLYIEYQVGNNFEEKHEIIPIGYQKLQNGKLNS